MSVELILPAAQRAGLALGCGLGGILVAQRGQLRGSILFARWRTWAASAPLIGLAVLSTYGAVAFVLGLTVQGVREYARLTGLPAAYRRALLAAGVVSAPLAVWSLTAWRALPPVLVVVATLLPLLRQEDRDGLRHLAYTVLGFVYIPGLLGYLLLIRERLDGGPGLLLATATAIAASDVWAFLIGRLAGRHRLAPRLSPGKTWEGAVGNLVGAYLGWNLMSFALPAGLSPGLRWGLPALIGAAALWGDLVESLVKRCAGRKDAGDWLPGFGGLLDRIDSLLVVAPAVYTTVVLAS